MSEHIENAGTPAKRSPDRSGSFPGCGETQAEIQARTCPEDLLRSYQQLEGQYQRCAQALATAAHDLRTPLAVVSGYIELLMSGKLGPLTDRQTRCLEDMYSSSQRLHRLITDFLTFSALQTGQFEPAAR